MAQPTRHRPVLREPPEPGAPTPGAEAGGDTGAGAVAHRRGERTGARAVGDGLAGAPRTRTLSARHATRPPRSSPLTQRRTRVHADAARGGGWRSPLQLPGRGSSRARAAEQHPEGAAAGLAPRTRPGNGVGLQRLRPVFFQLCDI